MTFIKSFYFKTIKQDFVNKFSYKNTKKIPKLKKIILDFNCKSSELKSIISCLLALEIIAKQKGKMTLANHSNVLLKLRKGNPIGCKVTLKKKNLFSYLLKNLLSVFPMLKNFEGFNKNKLKNNSFSYKISDTFSFKELGNNYYLFNNLPKLNVTIVTTTKTIDELNFLLKSFKLPIKKHL